jgi:gluconolactonase
VSFEVVASGLGFTEGPVFRQAGDIVVVSIERGHVYALDGEGGARLEAVPGGGPNGLVEAADGTLYVAQCGGRPSMFRRPVSPGGIQAIRPDGGIDWITQDPIAPNDLCFGPDGMLYVTDPTRGRSSHDDGRLWRVDVEARYAELLVSVPWHPNGIAFSREDDALYVASTYESRIVRYPLLPDGRLGARETVVQMTRGMPDGFAIDADGNFVIGAIDHTGLPGTVQVWDADGAFVDLVEPGAHAITTNVALSADRRLIVTESDMAAGAVLMADWPTAALPLHPFR